MNSRTSKKKFFFPFQTIHFSFGSRAHKSKYLSFQKYLNSSNIAFLVHLFIKFIEMNKSRCGKSCFMLSLKTILFYNRKSHTHFSCCWKASTCCAFLILFFVTKSSNIILIKGFCVKYPNVNYIKTLLFKREWMKKNHARYLSCIKQGFLININ